MQDNRDSSIDFVKGILAMLVVLGHCMLFGFSDSILHLINVENKFIFRLIYSFHMPLFMIISGYFTNIVLKKYRIKKIIKKRIVQLIGPLLFIVLVKLIITYITTNQMNFGILYKEFFTNLWFGWAIIYFTLIVILVEKVLKHKYFYLIIFILSFCLPSFPNIVVFRFEIPFFIIGFYSTNWIDYLNSKINRLNDINILILAIILIMFTILYSSKMPIHITPVLENCSILTLLFDIYRWTIGVINSVLIYIIFKYIYYKIGMRFTTFIVKLGIDSYYVYIIHSYIVQGILKKIALFYNIKFSYLTLMIEFVFVLIFTYILLILFKYLLSTVKYNLCFIRNKIM